MNEKEFFSGFCGALVCVALLGVSFLGGWLAKTRFEMEIMRFKTPVSRKAPAAEMSEEERRAIEADEERKAFQAVSNYSADTAYGIENEL